MPEAITGTDRFVYMFVNYVAWQLSDTPISPNVVTSLGLIFTVPLIWNIITRGSLFAGFCLGAFVNMLDCLDGAIARVCNKQTDFGAWYDQTADTIRFTSIFLASVYISWDKKWDAEAYFYMSIVSLPVILVLLWAVFPKGYIWLTRNTKFGWALIVFLRDNGLILQSFWLIIIKKML